MDLFTPEEPINEFEIITLLDGEILFIRNFLSPSEAKHFFDLLQNTINWKQEEISFYGKIYPIPRKTAWYGYEGFNYSYSGINCLPEIWTDELLDIKRKIEQFIPSVDFTSVLLNLYRNGNDKMGWHSDDEKELGEYPVVAGISLGQEREMYFKSNVTGEVVKVSLPHNSFYLMYYPTNKFWKHSIPRTTKYMGQRISLTFRCVKV